MKYVLPYFSLFLLSSCAKEKDISYPKSNTSRRMDQSLEVLYLVDTPSMVAPLYLNTDSCEFYRQSIKADMAEASTIISDLRVNATLSHCIQNMTDAFA